MGVFKPGNNIVFYLKIELITLVTKIGTLQLKLGIEKVELYISLKEESKMNILYTVFTL